jgi:hypothetical protein
MAHISQVALYLNALPPGKPVDVTVSPVAALPVRGTALANAVLTVNGRAFRVPFTLASGEFAERAPAGLSPHSRETGDRRARARGGADGTPALRAGPNTLGFSCGEAAGSAARAEVTVNAFGAPFGDAGPQRKINWEHLAREYEMPRLFLASNDVDKAVWQVAVRPGGKAALEVELCGAMDRPALTVNGSALRFPVALKAGERLICRDRRTWIVLDAKRGTIAEGRLEEKVPLLAAGANTIGFACASHDRALVKLTKVYE